VFPDGFLSEAADTLQLLFPTIAQKEKRRARHYMRKLRSDLVPAEDIERRLSKHEQIDLSRYKYFGARLAIIQDYYDHATPHTPRQWWYDRRNRVEWATLAVAVVVFVLTVVFGVISSVTGILQVYASFHPN
jgi:hypothetical protein